MGGTSTSREISKTLRDNKLDHIVTTATEYGKKLYEGVEIVVGRLNYKEMEKFIGDRNIGTIIDATHPYAVDVSRNTMEAARECGIPHIRYERKMCDYGRGKEFSTYEEVVDYLEEKDGNVLVTTGSNNLSQFNQNPERYYFRILPVEVSIKKAIETGISPKNIIGLQGPFTKEFNRAILKNYKISYLITKESGKEGGETEKIEACEAEGVEVMVIKRPEVKYEKIIYELEELLKEI